MKTVVLHLEEKDYGMLMAKKNGKTWKEFVMELAGGRK